MSSKIADLIAYLEYHSGKGIPNDLVWKISPADCRVYFRITYGDLRGLINELQHLTDVQKVTP